MGNCASGSSSGLEPHAALACWGERIQTANNDIGMTAEKTKTKMLALCAFPITSRPSLQLYTMHAGRGGVIGNASTREWCNRFGRIKMCLLVDANGCGRGKGTHVSVFVCLMRGEFDDYLKWPFNGTVTVQLKRERKPPLSRNTIEIDKAVPKECVCKPTEERNKGWGPSMYISHDELHAGGYLKDNKLFFCVNIELKP